MYSRLLPLFAAFAFAFATLVFAQDVPLEVFESGNPGAREEKVVLTPEQSQAIDAALNVASKGPKVSRPKVALQTLKVAKTQIGINRKDNQDRVSLYLELYGLPFQFKEGEYVRYCASGVGFVSCMAYREITGQETNLNLPNIAVRFRDSLPDVKRDLCYTHPLCQAMVDAAKKAHLWVPASKEAHEQAQPGWLVFYNWHGGSEAKHVGIVEIPPKNGKIHTVEFNTSDKDYSDGGAVLAQERDLTHIIGYINTYKDPE